MSEQQQLQQYLCQQGVKSCCRRFPFPAICSGGKLVYQYVKKAAGHPTCPVSGARLNGVSAGYQQHIFSSI
jgi:ribosomal protein L34E